MEEQVIQETPVATPPQPVAGADTAQPTLDVNSIKAEYESQINAFKAQAAEAEEKFQGIKAKLDEVYKKQDDQRKKVLQDQGQWKDLWKRPIAPPKKKTSKSPTFNANLRTFVHPTKPPHYAPPPWLLSARLEQSTPSRC